MFRNKHAAFAQRACSSDHGVALGGQGLDMQPSQGLAELRKGKEPEELPNAPQPELLGLADEHQDALAGYQAHRQTAKAVFNFGVIDAQLVEPKDGLLRVQLLKALTKASKHLALHLSAVVPRMGDEELDRLSILGKPRMS